MLRRLFLLGLCAAVLVAPVSATWSIVVVNRRTGEVAVGSATCIQRINLLSGLPTIVPGLGAGVIQASGDSSDLLPLTEGLRLGLPPAEILLLVQAAEPSTRLLQTGIVALYPGAPVTFTGGGVGRAKAGVVGEVGDFAYAIQGNVLAGVEVVQAAEAALLATNGDMGQKLLAAMQAARLLGGDGRCSCDFSRPDRCGAPPDDFEKSAHVGFMVVARIGDPIPPCVVANGNDCAQGLFHLRLNIRGPDAGENDPDPVDQLSERYAEWRASRAGRPDGLLSTVDAVASLPADGATKRSVTVRLVDVDGVPLTHGGAKVQVASADGARLNAVLGDVTDLGDGRYRFSLSATQRVGTDRLAITAEDDLVHATLYPFLEVRSEPPPALHLGRDALSASRGGELAFVLNLPAAPRAGYVLACGASAAAPGFPVARGTLDDAGRAELAVVVPAGALSALIGTRLRWRADFAEPGAPSSDVVELALVP